MQSQEVIHMRVLCSGYGSDRDLEPDKVRVELTSDSDIFFNYVC